MLVRVSVWSGPSFALLRLSVSSIYWQGQVELAGGLVAQGELVHAFQRVGVIGAELSRRVVRALLNKRMAFSAWPRPSWDIPSVTCIRATAKGSPMTSPSSWSVAWSRRSPNRARSGLSSLSAASGFKSLKIDPRISFAFSICASRRSAVSLACRSAMAAFAPAVTQTSADHSAQERQQHQDCGQHGPSVPPHEFAQPIPRRGWAGQNRLVVQVAIDVPRQLVGRLVAAVAILVQRLHHDPVQLATQESAEPLRIALPLGRDSRPLPGPACSDGCSGWADSSSRMIRRISSVARRAAAVPCQTG